MVLTLHIRHEGSHQYLARVFDGKVQVGAATLHARIDEAIAAYGTGGSQWFVTHAPQPHLEGRYTVFGQVVSGMDVVDRLEVGDTITRVRIWDGVTAPQ